MKKFLASLLFSACALTGLAHAGMVDDAVKRGTLRVGMDPTYMPFEMTNKRGEIIGFEVDLLKAMSKAMGVKLELVSTSYDGIIPALLTDKFDIANARLRFASGCIANLTASRISRDRVRKIRFFQPETYISIDYAAQEVEGWRLVRRNGGRPSIEGGALPIQKDEPLRRELADFVRATSTRSKPMVDGEAGRAALDLATQIAAKMESV